MATSSATAATANGCSLRRSNRNRNPNAKDDARASLSGRLEVTDVDMGEFHSLPDDIEIDAKDDIPAANDSEIEAESDDSEADASELRDDLASSGDETTEYEADSRDSESPNTDIMEDFIQYCFNHHSDPNNELTKEEAKSVNLMELLRKSKAPLSSYQPMLEWHLKETGDIQHWQTTKDTPDYVTRETLMKRLTKRYNCEAMHPKIKKVRLPFSKSVAHIPVRDAKDVILSLLADPRIDDDDYLFFDDDPLAPPPVEIKHLDERAARDRVKIN